MRIGIIYNERPSDLDRHDKSLEKLIEGDEWKTIHSIGSALSASGHQITYLKIADDTYLTLKAAKTKIDLLFNLAEGTGHGSDREAQVPMLAEILGIPYTGPGPLSSALILNKSRAKEIWKANGITTAKWQVFSSSSTKLSDALTFPLIVKPNGEGSGIGIKSNSIVKNHKELVSAIDQINHEYHQDALVEEYLPGREFTVALVGGGDSLITLPIVELNFAAFPEGVPAIDSYEAKFVYGATGAADMHKTEFCPADVDYPLATQITQVAKQAYQTIGCRDFGRVDIRLSATGEVYVMEINHPPGLMSDPEESSFFTIAARAHGWQLQDLVDQIILSATTRLGIS